MSTIDPARAPAAIAAWMEEHRPLIDAALALRLQSPAHSPGDPIESLYQAMRYAVLGGGKRLRPCLTLAACQACGGDLQDAMPAAVAVELLHAYTLVHDDLPAMDDDDMRRGRPTVHKQFDEATAILCGDALLTQSFECLADLPRGTAAAVKLFAKRCGRDELIGGQVLDFRWQEAEHAPSFEELERLHRGKTGALFSVACELGAIAAGASEKLCSDIGSYGMALGVAFQHADDVDDGDFPERREQAQARRKELAEQAIERLAQVPQPALLGEFVKWVGNA